MMTTKSNHKTVKHFATKTSKAVWMPPELLPMPEPMPPVAVTTSDVDHLLNTLPIKQARDLYDALHKIFGSAK